MIEISNLQKSFNERKILKNISFTIDDGEICGLVGRSGAGKSTLLRCINGLESYDAGSLKIDGFEVKNHSEKEIRQFRKNIGMIFQSFSLMERKTVYQNVALPMECWGYGKEEIDKRVKELLKIVDIEDKIHEKPRSLSGGQKQRVAIARALTLHPKILLCDEATSALDPKTTQSILLLLKKINETLGIAVVFVTHQMSVVRQICHKVCILENGEIMAKGAVNEVFMDQPQSLRNLLGENEEVILPQDGVTIKISYSGENVNDRLLSDMAQKIGVGFSLVWAKTEKYRDTVLGFVIINVDKNHISLVDKYLNDVGARWEVLTNE
ncbi:methionine ABC transporter ATP-binding protein [Pelosinus propionicus]|uniref:D-methionine transport system ATP-binding protein n=1 Tax=Pelosinus propionicus DSM 13327 TaxID=1123291 RepID=A0A1I4LDW4_9FIRM|nr:methionine ABC transporter ATP-binding protein [Pelosinus propionicus]SFL89202.1 D-methionine transport system ATP-binding protein [Pelosinus propionicus DSM 13327]